MRRPGAAPFLLLALAALALGPVLLRGGAVLVADMTLVADQPWKGAWLGLDGGVPRAVPADAFYWLLQVVLPGGIPARLLLLGTLWGAGLGMAHAVRREHPETGLVGQLAAAALYLWNPFVFQRLAIGHWGLLLGYAALPWAIAGARAFRRSEPHAGGLTVLAAAFAALGSPAGGLMVAIVAAVLAARRSRDWWVLVVALGVVNLPWLVPALVNGQGSADPSGAEAFAARADTPFGTFGSLATFGGIWKEHAVAGERSSVVLTALLLLTVLAGVVGLWRLGGRWILLAGAVSLTIAALPALPGGDHVARWVVGHAPGGGLLRDSQKWVMPWVAAACLGVGLLVGSFSARRAGQAVGAGRGLVVAALLVPVVLTPSMVWGLSGRLAPSRLPDDWARVRHVLDQESPDRRSTASLPWSVYQAYPYTNGNAVLDPALRLLPGHVITNTALPVRGVVVDGDGRAPARVPTNDPLALAVALRRAGARFALVQRSAVGGERLTLPAGKEIYAGQDLVLVDLGGSAQLPRSPAPGLILLADGMAAVTIAAAGVVLGRRMWRRSHL